MAAPFKMYFKLFLQQADVLFQIFKMCQEIYQVLFLEILEIFKKIPKRF